MEYIGVRPNRREENTFGQGQEYIHTRTVMTNETATTNVRNEGCSCIAVPGAVWDLRGGTCGGRELCWRDVAVQVRPIFFLIFPASGSE